MGRLALALPFIGMIIAEFAQSGLIVISKSVMSKGMSNFVFVFYCNTLASLILLPLSLFFHSRRSDRPQVTFEVLCGFLQLGLLGCSAQIFGYAGIQYSSPTLCTAMLNLVPGFTFILAIAFRMEKLEWGCSSSRAKFIGTIVLITGASIATLYQGPPIFGVALPSNSIEPRLSFKLSNWVIGGLLLAADCVMASAWLIVQASVLKKYPMELTVVFFYYLFAAAPSAVVSFIVERDPDAYSLKPNFRFVAVLYAAIMGYAFQVGVSTWCLHKTGPVFVAMFKPLGIVITVAIGVIFQGDAFYLGSMVGAILIVIGFYSVMWGKAKEGTISKDTKLGSSESGGPKLPLLQNVEER